MDMAYRIQDGASIDDLVDAIITYRGCGAPRSQQAETTIDGQPARISECPNQIEANVYFGGRLYLFTLEHTRSDARAVFDAFAATVDEYVSPGGCGAPRSEQAETTIDGQPGRIVECHHSGEVDAIEATSSPVGGCISSACSTYALMPEPSSRPGSTRST